AKRCENRSAGVGRKRGRRRNVCRGGHAGNGGQVARRGPPARRRVPAVTGRAPGGEDGFDVGAIERRGRWALALRGATCLEARDQGEPDDGGSAHCPHFGRTSVDGACPPMSTYESKMSWRT